MFKKLALLIALLSVGVAANAVPITYTAITNLIETDLASSSTITAAELRGVLNGMNDSYPNLVDAGVTKIQFGYLSGVTQDVQAQINNKQEESAKNAVSGYAGLDANGLLTRSQIPNPSYCLGTATFAAGLYTIASPTPSYASASEYNDGFLVIFRPDTINTGNSSLKVGSGPSKVIYLPDATTTLGAGDIATNSMMMCVYNTSLGGFVLMDPATSVLLDANQFGLTTNLNTLGAYIKSGATLTNSFLVTPTLKNGTATVGHVPRATDTSGNWLWSSETAGTEGTTAIVVGDAQVGTNVTQVIVMPTNNCTITLAPANLGQRIRVVKGTNNAFIVKVAPQATNAIVGTASPFPLYFRGDGVELFGDGTSTNHYFVGGNSWANGNRPNHKFTGVVGLNFANTTSTSSTGPDALSHTVVNTGATVSSISYSALGTASGVWQWNTGSTTNGAVNSTYRVDYFQSDANPCIFSCHFQIPSNLSTAVDEYIIELGFGDYVGTNDLGDSDAILLRYDRTQSTNFRIKTVAGGAGTAYLDTGVAVAIATWYSFTVLVTSNVVTAKLDNTVLGPITGTLPAGSAQAYTPLIRILKVGGSTGTNQRLLSLDDFECGKFSPSR